MDSAKKLFDELVSLKQPDSSGKSPEQRLIWTSGHWPELYRLDDGHPYEFAG
jgi:hypothetical protein